MAVLAGGNLAGNVMTSTHHPTASRAKRPAGWMPGRGRAQAVAIGGGVQMSCQEVDDDHAVIRFAWPSSARRRARPLKRET